MNNDFMSDVFEDIEDSSMVKDHRSIANDDTNDTSTQDNESYIDQYKRSVVQLIRNSVLDPPTKDMLINQVHKKSSIPSIRVVENIVNTANNF